MTTTNSNIWSQTYSLRVSIFSIQSKTLMFYAVCPSNSPFLTVDFHMNKQYDWNLENPSEWNRNVLHYESHWRCEIFPQLIHCRLHNLSVLFVQRICFKTRKRKLWGDLPSGYCRGKLEVWSWSKASRGEVHACNHWPLPLPAKVDVPRNHRLF